MNAKVFFAILGIPVLTAVSALAQPAQLDTSRYKMLYPTLSAAERAQYERALAAELEAATALRPTTVHAPGPGDLCTLPTAAPVSSPWTVSATTVGTTNNYDIATTCGVAQTLFAGTGASLDFTFGVFSDQNCTATASVDPTGANWDVAIYVLRAVASACIQLPTLADQQCVTMDDDGAANTTESVSWPVIAGVEYYVIIDGFNAAVGTFDLTLTGCIVPVELQSFSVDR